jgi:hypothetical protein
MSIKFWDVLSIILIIGAVGSFIASLVWHFSTIYVDIVVIASLLAVFMYRKKSKN